MTPGRKSTVRHRWWRAQPACRKVSAAGLVAYWIDDGLEPAQPIAIVEYLDETHRRGITSKSNPDGNNAPERSQAALLR